MNRRDKKKLFGAALAGVSAIMVTQVASAQQDVWNGSAGDSLWTTANNWSAGIPTSTNQAYFNSSGNGDTSISLSGSNQVAAAVVFDVAGTPSYDIGTTPGDMLSVYSNNVSGGYNGTGAISILAPVTNSQEIDASINLLGSSPIITNLSATSLTFGSAGTSATFNVNVTNAASSLQLTPNVAGGSIVFNEAITGAVGGIYTPATATSGGSTSGGLLQGGAGVIQLNAQNNYSGYTYFNSGQGTIVQLGSSSIVTAGNIVSGPFGVSTMDTSKGNNDVLEAVGTNQTVANPMNLVGGIIFGAATNTTAYNLSLTGAITYGGTAGITILNEAAGQNLTLGAAGSNASTFTLSPLGNINVLFNNVGNSALIINDVIQDNPSAPGTPDTITYGQGGSAGSSNLSAGTVYLNGANTYSGSTIVNAALSGATGTTFEIGVSSVGSPGSIVSGPFGKGTIVLSTSTKNPASFIPNGADQTIANALVMKKGFGVFSNGTSAFSLTFSGPITDGGFVVTNDLVSGTAGSALIFGAATNPSTLTITGTATFQSQAVGEGITVFNDNITGTGALTAQQSATVYLNGTNSFSGGLNINGYSIGAGTIVVVSSDANLGSSTGGINFSGTSNTMVSTLLSTGTFTSARTINLNTASGTSNVVVSNPIDIIDATGTNVLTLTGAFISGTNGTGDLTKGTNVGTLQLAQPSGYTFSGNVNALGGTLAFGTNGGSIGPVNVPGALNVSDGAVTQFLPSTTAHVLNTVNTLNLNNTGLIDLSNSDLSVNNSLSQVRSYLAQAYAGGAWTGTSGITSSVVEANPSTLSIAYVSGANTNNAALNPALTNTSAVLLRPSLIGDFNLDGKVDRFDIRQFNARNAFNDGLTTHDWADGDLNGDGKVDRFDIRILNASNNFNSGNTFVAQAQAQTLSSSVSPATGNSINNPTTVGTVGDGKPDLIYNPSTGDVVFSYDGYNPGTGKELVEIDVQSSKSDLNPSGANTSAAQFVSKASNDVDYQDVGTGIADGVDLGTIMPVGSTPAALTNGDIVVNLYLNGEGTSNKYADITSTPEPTTLSLMGLAAAGLLGRRRKQSKDKSQK